MPSQAESYNISRVYRDKEEAKHYYNRISSIYDWLGGAFERRPAEKTLGYLGIKSGEIVLEIGFGTGYCLHKIASAVGNSGKTYGIDISEGMLQVTGERLRNAGLIDRVELYLGDAIKLPFTDETFDSVFMSFTLELFDTPGIPLVLNEVRRVLKKGGRLGIVSLSKAGGNSTAVRIYEWIHSKWPKYVDCRPIYLDHSLQAVGYTIKRREMDNLFLLPLEIVIAMK
jgi:ubiquinone/menaquinone biosynthesis C-methylase UbiE